MTLQNQLDQIAENTELLLPEKIRAMTSLFFGYGTKASVQDAARVLLAIEQQATKSIVNMPDAFPSTRLPSGY